MIWSWDTNDFFLIPTAVKWTFDISPFLTRRALYEKILKGWNTENLLQDNK